MKPEELKAIREDFCNKVAISMHDPAEIQETVFKLADEVERLRGVIQWFMEEAGWADAEHPLRDYGLLIPSRDGRAVYERFRKALEGGESA